MGTKNNLGEFSSGPTNGKLQAGRITFRIEDDQWKAYYVFIDEAEKIYLGSIMMSSVVYNKKRRKEFMSLMRGLVSDLISEAVGVRPSWTKPIPVSKSEMSNNS